MAEGDCETAGETNIFYTRLHIEDGQVRKGLPPNITCDTFTTYPMMFNPDSNIFCASARPLSYYEDHYIISNYNTYPVIYRDVYKASDDTTICNLEHYFPSYNRTSYRIDRLYWSDNQSLLEMNVGILSDRLVYSVDTVDGTTFVPTDFTVGGSSDVWSSGKYLDQPVVSAGEAYNYDRFSYYQDLLNCLNFSPRAMNLNFRSRQILLGGDGPFYPYIADTLAKIMHFPQEMFVELENISVSTIDQGRLSNSHLAERGSVNQNDWQRNHRIYNRQDSFYLKPRPAPTIRSSGQYFFKTTAGETIARRVHCFGDDSLKFGIAAATIRGREYLLRRKPLNFPFDGMKSPDTLSTDWFVVDDFDELRLITAGNTPVRLTALLERRSDGSVWDIECTAGELMRLSDELIDLLNGDDEEYRIRICSNGGAPYHLETAIVDDDEETGFGKVGLKENGHIDLGSSAPTQTVFVYPNPARDEVHVTIKGTAGCEVIIISAMGAESARLFVDGGQTIAVNTSGLPSGMYFVRVKRGVVGDVVVPFVVFR